MAKINFSIDTLAEGAGKELIERELSDIFNNINDPNADPTKKRSLIVKVDFVPDADYDEVKASITGEKVEDVEKKSNKIIDLQEKRG